ncbi:Uncharacterized protein FWK35_00032956, partial [Aphis craccivora]
LHFVQNLKSIKNSRFSLIFFLFFGFSRCFLKLLGNSKNDLPNAPTRFTFKSEKLLKLKIEALFRHVLVYTDTQKKHTTL